MNAPFISQLLKTFQPRKHQEPLLVVKTYFRKYKLFAVFLHSPNKYGRVSSRKHKPKFLSI